MHASASVALLLCLVHSSAAFAPPVQGPGRGGVSARALPRLSQPCVPLRRVVPVPRLPRRPPARLPPRVPPETVGTAPRAGDGDAAGGARPEIAALKQRLVEAVRAFKAVQARDGAVSVDFGVGGGELDGGGTAPAACCLLRACTGGCAWFPHLWMPDAPTAHAPAPRRHARAAQSRICRRVLRRERGTRAGCRCRGGPRQ